MVLYYQTLSSFPSFQHQIEHFLCHWECKIKNFECPLNLKSKGTKQRTHEEKKWYFVSKFLLFLTTISCLFLIHFEQFQRLQMCYFNIYKTYLKWKVNKTIVKELKFQNHIEHLWKNSKHNPLHFERAYLVHFPLYCSIFYIFGYARWRITKKFKFQKRQTMDKRVIMIQYC
jgi:hypothetical protein